MQNYIRFIISNLILDPVMITDTRISRYIYTYIHTWESSLRITKTHHSVLPAGRCMCLCQRSALLNNYFPYKIDEPYLSLWQRFK